MKKHYDYDIKNQQIKQLFLTNYINSYINIISLYNSISKNDILLHLINKLGLNEFMTVFLIIRTLCELSTEPLAKLEIVRNWSFVNNVDYAKEVFYLDTLFGTYEFSKIVSPLDCPTKSFEFYKENKVKGKCHEISLYNMPPYPIERGVLNHLEGKELLTFFATNTLKNYFYLHSAILHDGIIYDVANNFKMDEESYKQLIGYEHVSSLTWEKINQDLLNEFDGSIKAYFTNPDMFSEFRPPVRKKTV